MLDFVADFRLELVDFVHFLSSDMHVFGSGSSIVFSICCSVSQLNGVIFGPPFQIIGWISFQLMMLSACHDKDSNVFNVHLLI